MTPSTPSSDHRPSAQPAAVLFDLDGTLVDSERLWLDAIRARLALDGAAVSSAQLVEFEGLSSIEAAHALIEVGGLSARAAEVAADLEALTIDTFADRLSWVSGAEEALGHLRGEGIRIALVTSSTHRWVDAVAESLALGAFDVVVTADDVQHTKPDPEPYLQAFDLLGIDPGTCLVFEDSEVGVRRRRGRKPGRTGTSRSARHERRDRVHPRPPPCDRRVGGLGDGPRACTP